jgi:cytidylate kinase
MENPSPHYISGTFRDQVKNNAGCPYPFVTISREYGCPSKLIAKMLENALNRKLLPVKGPRWSSLNKEIVLEAARELNLNPTKVNSIFNTEYLGDLEDVFASFSSNYKSNRRIQKTIREVVKSFVRNGYIIIVGRGGVAITQGCPNALHIRLQAPLEWRISKIIERYELSPSEALRRISDIDKKRTTLIEQFLGKKFDASLFDLIYNCQSFKMDDIVSSIINVMEQKKMI